jgi:type II secretion system (T2SS) protein E
VNPKKRLGEMLMEAGIIGETQLKAALGHQRQWGVRLGQALVDLKLATEADIVRALSAKFGFPVAQLANLEPYALEQAVKLVPREFAVHYNVFPMAADTASLTVAMSDPTNLSVVDEIRFRTGRRVKVCMGGDREVAEAVRRHYPAADGEVEAIALDLDADEGQPEAVLDPFGGGSKDALEAFFGHGPQAAAAPAPAAAAPAPSAVAATAAAAPVPTAARAAARPSAAPSPAARPAAAPAAPAQVAPVAPRPAAAPRAAAPARAAVPVAPRAAPPAAAPAAAASASAPPAAAAPRPAAPAAARPAAAAPARAAQGAPSAAPPPSAPSAAHAAPRVAPPAPARPVELELEEPVDPSTAAAAPFAAASEAAPADASQGEPILATELAPREASGPDAPAATPFTPEEVAILDALERLAAGHHAEPDILKPAQAMAALVRLLVRRRIISEREFLDELRR